MLGSASAQQYIPEANSIKMLPVISAEWNHNLFLQPYMTTAGDGQLISWTTQDSSVTTETQKANPNFVTKKLAITNKAGSATYTTFTVTNNKVAATDVIIINQKSGTDKYEAYITNVSAGSFAVTFADMSGTTTEQPVFSFAVIKGATA